MSKFWRVVFVVISVLILVVSVQLLSPMWATEVPEATESNQESDQEGLVEGLELEPTPTPAPTVNPRRIIPSSSGNVKIVVNGKELSATSRSANAGGVTLLSVPDVFTALGWSVNQHRSESSIVMYKGEFTLFILEGRDRYLIRDRGKPDRLSAEMDVVISNIDGSLMLPAVVIGEAIKADVEWDGATSTLRIITADFEEDESDEETEGEEGDEGTEVDGAGFD